MLSNRLMLCLMLGVLLPMMVACGGRRVPIETVPPRIQAAPPPAAIPTANNAEVEIALTAQAAYTPLAAEDEETPFATAQLIEAQEAVSPVEIDSEVLAAVVADQNRFALELFQQMVERESSNILIAPHNVYTTFAMLLPATRGDTRTQLVDTFHFSRTPYEIAAALQLIHKPVRCHDLSLCLPENLLMVDDMWTAEPALVGQIDADYLRYLKGYDSGLYSHDLQMGAPLPQVATTPLTGTAATVTDSPPPSASAAMLALSNARLSFAAPPMLHSAPFTRLDGVEAPADMVQYLPAYYSYSDNDTWQSIRIPDVDNRSLVLILPHEGFYNEVEESLTAETLTMILDSTMTEATTYSEVTIPAFRIQGATASYDLTPVLSAMGVVDLFDPTRADLAGVTAATPLYLAAARHSVGMTVEENDLTLIPNPQPADGMPTPPTPLLFRADRPFIFVIQDNHTGAIEFIGRLIER